MAERSRPGLYVLVLLTGLLALAGCLALVGSALVGPGGVADAAKVAGLVSFVLTIPSAVISLWSWSRRLAVPVAVLPAQLSTAKEVLAELVSEQWRVEAVLRSLDDPDPIPVQWHVTRSSEVMDHPVNLGDTAVTTSVSGTDVAALGDWFRALRRRRLVILGGPGSGKTTMAVQLVRELLATRAQHGEEPVPVLLSAAGWDTNAFPHLHDWVAHRLAQDYPPLRAAQFGTDIPRLLAVHSHILPILDGMDELPSSAQAAIIKALNRSLSGTDQVIVTSRTTDYVRAVETGRDVLTSAVVIEPEPLMPQVAARYLQRCLPPRPGRGWERVLEHLSTTPGTALADVAAVPFGLWLLRTVYRTPGADPATLLDAARSPDAATLRAHLLDQLIAALIDIRTPGNAPGDVFRPRRRHDPDHVRAWLGYLAQLTSGTRDLMWWRLAHETGAVSRAVRLAMTIVITVVVGLTGAVLTALADGWRAGFVPGLGYGSVVGLAAGAMVGFTAGSWSQQLPGFADLRLHGRASVLVRGLSRGLGRGLALGLLVGLAMGLVVGLTAGLEEGLVAGPVFGLAVGLTSGLASGFTAWAENPAPTGRASTPLSSWQADRALNLLRAATIGGTSGITAGLVTGLAGGLGDTLEFGLAIGITHSIAFGLAAGLAAGNHHSWMAYLIATHRSSRLPRALMSFLDDAHRLGLLRAVGPVYQFRHAELHEHFASTYDPMVQAARTVT